MQNWVAAEHHGRISQPYGSAVHKPAGTEAGNVARRKQLLTQLLQEASTVPAQML